MKWGLGLQAQFEAELNLLKAKNLFRSPNEISAQTYSSIAISGKSLINFSSNNYLGLSTHPKVIAAAIQAAHDWGAGSGASRLLSGNFQVHLALEEKIASFKKEEAALVFSSGYLGNLTVVTSLLDKRDVVILDRFCHASLVDAARLSGARLWVYPHRDVAILKKRLEAAKKFRRRLVLTDSYFSMDGDVAPLDQLLDVCKKNEALLMVDEAHATGVFGKNGRGLTEHFGLQGQIDVVMGTLSKALGSVGGFFAGKAVLRKILVNFGRGFIYSTAPSPPASASAFAALGVIENEPSLRLKLWDNVRWVRENLSSLGFDLMGSEGPIIPILVGDTRKCISFYDTLKKEGIFAPAIRPPTVPKRTDRIRLSIQASHSKEDLKRLLGALKKCR